MATPFQSNEELRARIKQLLAAGIPFTTRELALLVRREEADVLDFLLDLASNIEITRDKTTLAWGK